MALEAQVSSARICQIVLFASLLTIPAHAQQIASADLAHPLVAIADANDKQEKDEVLKECEKRGGFRDGFTMAEDHEPRRIKVEVVKISSTQLEVGSDLEGTVKLQNLGKQPIQIPWNTDFRTTKEGQDPKDRSWVVGEFRIKLKNKEDDSTELTSLSQVLYSSDFVSGSTLTLKQGEWITAQISFRMEARHPAYEEVKEGPSMLVAEWFQTNRTHKETDCGVTFGYYPYTLFYQQDNPPIVVGVENSNSDKNKKTAQQ
jgi:hypothetical protein